MKVRVPPPPESCYDSALRILELRWHGAEELRKKLRRKGFDLEAIEPAIERLTSEKWLDDHRFASAFASGRIRKGRSNRAIAIELGELGVDRGIAAAVLALASDESSETDRLTRLCRKKLKTMAGRSLTGADRDRTRNKLLAYLLRQGYEYHAAAAIISRELGSSSDPEPAFPSE